MKKKYLFILPILILAELLSGMNFVNAFSYNLINFSTNQTKYYIDESIKISATWVLNYNPNSEDAYVQVHIVDEFAQFVWNSSMYNQIGTCEKNWTVNIGDFDLDLENSSCFLYIKFFVFYFHIDTGSTMCYYLTTIEVSVMKRNISCELLGYKDRIIFGENLNLKAKFYDESANNTRYLINQSVQFMISFNDLIITQCNYTTNMSGVISFQLLSATHLMFGLNFLIFSIDGNNLYNNSKFIYKMQVEKNVPIIDIVNFNSYLEENEDLKMKLYCYYYVNQSQIRLANHRLIIKIFDNTTLIFTNEYETDKNGLLEISISQDSFNSDQKPEALIINILSNETYFFDNVTITLNLNLYHEKINSAQLKIVSFTSIIIIVLIFLSYIIISKKGKNKKLLKELIISY